MAKKNRKKMMDDWNLKYGPNSRDTRRLAGKPSSGLGITEDDPRWPQTVKGREKMRKRRVTPSK